MFEDMTVRDLSTSTQQFLYLSDRKV